MNISAFAPHALVGMVLSGDGNGGSAAPMQDVADNYAPVVWYDDADEGSEVLWSDPLIPPHCGPAGRCFDMA